MNTFLWYLFLKGTVLEERQCSFLPGSVNFQYRAQRWGAGGWGSSFALFFLVWGWGIWAAEVLLVLIALALLFRVWVRRSEVSEAWIAGCCRAFYQDLEALGLTCDLCF